MQHAAPRRMICGRGGTCSLQPLSVELMGTARGQKVLILDTTTLKCLEEQGRRALSAGQQPTDAMKRNVMG